MIKNDFFDIVHNNLKVVTIERFIYKHLMKFFMAREQALEELLIAAFEIEKERAVKTAEATTSDTFLSNFDRLEKLIGFGNAKEVVKEGKFFDYQNGLIDTYFQLAYVAAGRMDPSLPIPPKPFYSIDSLKEFLGVKEVPSPTEQRTLDLTKFRLLRLNDQNSVRYLQRLIDEGELVVDKNEYWGQGRTLSSVRGSLIIQRIAYELNLIFKDLGFDGPRLTTNIGQNRLTILEYARKKLSEVREMAYAMQRPTRQ